MSKKKIATKLEVLLFIKRKEIVTVWDLIGEYDYSYRGATNRLQRLKKQGLIEQLDRGQWILTNQGDRRLTYHGI